MKTKLPAAAIDCEIVPEESANTALALPEPLHNLYHRCAQTAAAQATGYAILCGLELQRIRVEMSSKGGRPKKLQTPLSGVSEGWESWVKANCEFSAKTALRYIEVAEGVKGRIAQVSAARNLGGMLDLAPSAMDAGQREKLLQTVSKVTAGQTLQQLYLDFGITKSDPHANLRKGGATHHNGRPSVNWEAEACEVEAVEIMTRLSKWLSHGRHQVIALDALRHMDELLLAARETLRPFLKAPKNLK